MVEDLIRRARRRLIADEVFRQVAFALAVTLGGLTALLIVGTRFLEWWSLGLFAAAGLVAGAVRVFRRMPDPYATAVLVDRNAGLQDSLATAWSFSGRTAEFAEPQRQQAELAARAVHLETAVPFTFPRPMYAVVALGLAATALFAVRYFRTGQMDLRAPLTEVFLEDAAHTAAVRPKTSEHDALARKRLETAESLLAKLGIPLNPDDRQNPEALDKALDKAFENPGATAGKGEKQQGDKAGGQSGQQANGDPLDDHRNPEDGGKDAGKNSEPKDGAQKNPGAGKNGGDNQGLLSRLKDAVSNMLSKSGASESSPGQKGAQQQPAQDGKQQKGAGQKGSGSKSQDPGQNQSDAQDGQPNGEAQQGAQSQGKAGAKSSQPSSQSGNGVGAQDGSKDLQAAEQLKAMGKISEIIGKRAATVTGETTIEVQSGNQQLRTAYSNSKAAHGEADSDVSRDEIPPDMQNYVQQYFEQVRKAGAPAKAKTTP